jgi:hypothetical protein
VDRGADGAKSDRQQNALPFCQWIVWFVIARSIVVFVTEVLWAEKGASICAVVVIVG